MWQLAARASTVSHLHCLPTNMELSKEGRKSFVAAIDPHQWNMELPQVLLSTTQCHPSCAASLRGSLSKPETALTFRKPCWCYCSRVLVPKSLDKTADYHVQCLKQRWEATPYFQGSPLESATWQQKHQFIVKVILSPSPRENPQIHRRRDFSAWSPADSNGQTASSGIWPQKRTVLEAHL